MVDVTPIAYVNGAYVPLHEARIALLDRAALFADAVYEVMWVEQKRLIDFDSHWNRFVASAQAIAMKPPHTKDVWRIIMKQLIARNGCRNGGLYWHMSRGVMMRNHAPQSHMTPQMVAFVNHAELQARCTDAITVITAHESRWKRCDIKTVGLLPNVMARMRAAEQHKNETWFVNDDGRITEGAACNGFIVDEHNVLRTHPATEAILAGVVRNFVVQAAARLSIDCREDAFSLTELKKAKEAFCTGTLQGVIGVSSVDDIAVPYGADAPITRALQDAYEQHLTQ